MNLRKVPFEYSQQQPFLKGDSIAPIETYENTQAVECETSQSDPILIADNIGSTETCKSATDESDSSKGTDQDFRPIRSPTEKRPRNSDEVASVAVQYSDQNDGSNQVWLGKRNKIDNYIDMDQNKAQNAIQNDIVTSDNEAEGDIYNVDDDVLRSPPSLFDFEKMHEVTSLSEGTTAPKKMAQVHPPDYDQDVSIPCENMLVESDASLLQECPMAEITGGTVESMKGSHSMTHVNNIRQPENDTVISATHLQSNSNLGDGISRLLESSPKFESTIESIEPPLKIESTIESSEDLRIQSTEVVKISESPSAEKEILDTIALPIRNVLEGDSSTQEKIRQNFIKDASALKLYTSLCDTSTTGISLTTRTNTDLDESERTSTFSYHFKQSLSDVKSVLLGSLRSVIQLQHLLLQFGGGKSSDS